jgi:hypothetical protein
VGPRLGLRLKLAPSRGAKPRLRGDWLVRGGFARASGVLLVGALVLHELRYALGYGSDAQEALARHGHAYLEQLIPALVALSVALVGGTLLAPRSGRGAAAGRGLLGRAALYAGLLLAVFCAQELAEAWLAGGHPGGVDALVAHGGWTAIPLALALGAIAAMATRGLERVEVRLAAAYSRRLRHRPRIELRSFAAGAETPPLAALPLAFGLARRPPPAALLI